MHAETQRVLDTLRIAHLADRLVSEIPTGMARRVEMGRALMTHPRVLLLDEPASGQDEQETVEFGELLLELAAAGTGILLVEHDVGARDAGLLATSRCSTSAGSSPPAPRMRSSNNQQVIAAYLGAEHSS